MTRLLVALFSLSFLFACGGGDDTGGGGGDEGPKGGTLTLAAVLPISGPNAAVGNEASDAVKMAVEEWAPKFAEKGWTLKVKVEDDASDPKQAMSAAYAVSGDPTTFGVVAHYNSGCFLPASEVYHSAGTMAISPATTNVDITLKGYPEIARVTPHDGVQGELTADFVKNHLSLAKLAVIHDRTQYGQGLAEVFRDHGGTIGLEILSFDGIQVGDKDFKALLTKIREDKPEAIYFGGLYDEAGFLVKQMRELGMESVFISDDGSYGQDFFDVGGSATEGSILSFPGTPIDKLEPAQAFLAGFQSKYGRPVQNYGPYAYDAANILLTSAMGAVDAGADSKGMRAAVVQGARAIDHSGALGQTKFDDKGDTLNQRYSFYKATDGKFEYIATFSQGE
ncbi:MAG: branched-chain amino acid ABC transporter substrate-binding protein [Proteobacteria bacterium]|nr:branched-chain amino acid ABC transporter substrate-binding protein [Pseudomonadota bacterium]